MSTRRIILFLAANPLSTSRLAIDAEAREVEAKFLTTPLASGVRITTRWAVTPDDLLHALNADRPTIVHFSGHGAGPGGLVFQQESGGASPVSAAALRRVFAALRDNVRVVVLNACHSEHQASAIVEVVDCVVGMTNTIGDTAARRFASSFYRALGFGRSVQNAFEQGVASIALHGLGDEAVPQLKSRVSVDPHGVCPFEARGHLASSVLASSDTKSTEPDHPYPTFLHSFREIVAPIRYRDGNAVLNLVFGNLADCRDLVPVLPINQSFDFEQRGPRSVLAAFSRIVVGGVPFFDAIGQLWPTGSRPKAAGLGVCQFVPLPVNSTGLPGVLFVVTTRNLSTTRADTGYYVNTPLEGIDLVLRSVIHRVRQELLPSMALPLLGAGYANIRRGLSPQAELSLQKAVLGLSIIHAEEALNSPENSLKRIVIAVHSNEPHSNREHEIWSFVLHALSMDREKRRAWFPVWWTNRLPEFT